MTPGSCQERLLHDFGEPASLAGLIRPQKAGRYLSLLTQRGSKEERIRTLHLLDLVSGARRVLTTSACNSPADFSKDERMLAYAECPPPGQPGHSTIHRVSLDDGVDVTLADAPGRAWSVFMSPSGDRVAMKAQAGDRDVVIEGSGQVMPLEPGWTVMGWNGDNRLVLTDAPEGGGQHSRLALAAAGTWEPREFFPRSSASP